MSYVVTEDPKEFAKQNFKAGQQPAAWLRSAGRLRDAAEVILNHELPAETSYSQAAKAAEEEAIAVSVRDGTDAGVAEIEAIAPNYPPAQLLYAYGASLSSSGRASSKKTSCTASCRRTTSMSSPRRPKSRSSSTNGLS
jgi:hypothetical protein